MAAPRCSLALGAILLVAVALVPACSSKAPPEPPQVSELEALLDKVALTPLDDNYRIGGILLRADKQWRKYARTIATEKVYDDPWTYHLRYNGTILCDFLAKVGPSFYLSIKNGDGKELTRQEEQVFAKSVVTVGRAKRFRAPHPADLVVVKRLSTTDSKLDDEYNYNILRGVWARGMRQVKRIVVVAAVVYDGQGAAGGGGVGGRGGGRGGPSHDHDFAGAGGEQRALKARVAVLLEELAKTYPQVREALSGRDLQGWQQQGKVGWGVSLELLNTCVHLIALCAGVQVRLDVVSNGDVDADLYFASRAFPR